MQNIQILVICANEEILQTILRLINKEEKWQAAGAPDIEKAVALFQQSHFDLLLLGSGISEEAETKLINKCREIDPGIKIIQHFGGGSGLLFNEITAVFTGDKNANFSVRENVTK